MTTILVVEDCTITCDLLSALLQKEGYEVITANDGISGLKAAQTQSPDLAILDLHLPDLSGVEIAGLLLEEVPFIALTMDRSLATIQACIQKGAFGYLIKPTEPDHLIRHVAVALQRGSDGRTVRRNDRHLRRALDHHQVIDKALGVLMGFLRISEPTAAWALKHRSSKTNLRVLVLAEHIMAAMAVLSEATDQRTPQTAVRTSDVAKARAFLNSFRKSNGK